MKSELKKAIKDLIEVVDDELHNEDNWYVRHFMPEEGTHTAYDKYENRNYKYNITRQDALEEGQYGLLGCKDNVYLQEFITEGKILDKVVELVRQIGWEIYNGKNN